MAAIRERDIPAGERAWQQWNDAAQRLREDGADSESLMPALPRPTWAMAVRYTLYLLERKAPGPGVEVRVAPWGAVKILDGPASDPHNLTPPDVIELDPEVWLRLAAGITTWSQEKDAGRITAVGERDFRHGRHRRAAAHADARQCICHPRRLLLDVILRLRMHNS